MAMEKGLGNMALKALSNPSAKFLFTMRQANLGDGK
jgi:hypothetical protein